MAKFKVLKYNKHMLFELGIFQQQFPQSSLNGFFRSPIIVYMLLISFTFFISSTLYANQNLIDFNASLRASLFSIGTAQVAVMFICFGFNAHKIQDVHFKLQELVDKANEGNSTLFL